MSTLDERLDEVEQRAWDQMSSPDMADREVLRAALREACEECAKVCDAIGETTAGEPGRLGPEDCAGAIREGAK